MVRFAAGSRRSAGQAGTSVRKAPRAELRDTAYARELASGVVVDGDSEIRIERLYVKESGVEEIRFSWWRDGRLIPRPADLPESQLLRLIEDAISKQVFSNDFLTQLRVLLNKQ